MARKTIGHVELQWTCPNCGGINPGPVKACQSCGAPQPEDVVFEQAVRQELITDEEKLAQAEAGADIHCPYCGTRNPAGAETCSQCGGDLVEGVQRESGQVVGAFVTGPETIVKCPRCGAENTDIAKTCQQCGAPMQREEVEAVVSAPPTSPPTAKKSSPTWLIIGAVIAFVAICAVLFFIFFRTEEVTGTVQSVNWERSIPIEAFGPVRYQDWEDQIPTSGSIIQCEEKYHHTQDQSAPNANEICGTPYTVDSGSGFGEVVQDCVYEVYESYCEYTVDEWYVTDSAVLSGSDFSPDWPDPELDNGMRLSDNRQEEYVIVFSTEDGTRRFVTSSYDLFQQARIGTTWTLEINQIDGVVSISR